VFELLLRLKANYLWPAMWNNAFNEDDALDAKLADEYGIVMGTSHHEPMLRAQQEWKRHGTGPWDYSRNADVLRAFWEEGVRRNKDYESIITLGMRGDGDMPMSRESNTALLERIVSDQRKIIAAEVNPDVTKVPQDWALYKEVQEYYEKGMRVPDDVTLLWCDDNWGNIRRLPTPEERKRSGGAGIYYHFDYVGGPRNYKWIDTNPIPKVWEQMHLASEYGANRIWIVNVGDLKPMEFPTEFFLSLARDPARWPKEKLGEFTGLWAAREFGEAHAAEIADLVAKTLKYNGRRKPELLESGTYSVIDYLEADRVVAEYDAVVSRAEAIERELAADARDAFFELVLHPAKANAIVTALYVAAAKNRLYAAQGRASANDLAAQTRQLFQADADLTARFNHTLAHGKWDHMMDQTHIGYTAWNDPPANVMPAVSWIQVPDEGSLGVSAEDATFTRAGGRFEVSLGTINSVADGTRTLTLFDRSKTPVDYTVETSAPWIVASEAGGRVGLIEQKVVLRVDWNRVPADTDSAEGTVAVISGEGRPMTYSLRALRLPVTRAEAKGFVESDGYVAMEAADTSARTADGETHWEELPGYGETKSAMTVFPVTAESNTDSKAGLAYRIYLYDSGDFQLQATLAPTLNFVPGRGLRFAVSVDGGARTVVDELEHNSQQDWEQAVSDGVRRVTVPLAIAKSGAHSLEIWAVDPGVVLERLVLSHGPLKPSYLGPPESARFPG
jgi:hypothetical protein